MRIAVVGAGGTGGLFGALLARASEAVTFIARGAHLNGAVIRLGQLRGVPTPLNFAVAAALAPHAAGRPPGA